jgi:glycosyltransferase involved in cell wall biosynthesis
VANSAPAAIAVIVPAYRPPPSLEELVRELCPSPLVEALLVVDDGSGQEFAERFAALASQPKVTVLRHRINQGKGAALKTAMAHALATLPGLAGVVTADADGQHAAADVLRAGQLLAEGEHAVLLGVRRVGSSAPLRSRFGNWTTRHVLRLVSGITLSDTQSGLRGIPLGCLAELTRLPENGYDYEMDMILACGRLGWPIREMPAETIYLEGNRSSHFDPLRDSLRIYYVLLRYFGSSLLAALVDNLVFFAAFVATANILGSQVLGRAASVSFNYWLNRNSVFFSKAPHRSAVAKYLALVVASGALSYGLILAFVALGFAVLPAKICAESLVFFLNFWVQRAFIFASEAGP